MSINQWPIHKNYRFVFIIIAFLVGSAAPVHAAEQHPHFFSWSWIKHKISSPMRSGIQRSCTTVLTPAQQLINGSLHEAQTVGKNVSAKFTQGNLQVVKTLDKSNAENVQALNNGVLGATTVFDESCKTSLTTFDKILERGFYRGALCGAALLGTHYALSNVDYKTNPQQSGTKLWLGSGLAAFSTLILGKMWWNRATRHHNLAQTPNSLLNQSNHSHRPQQPVNRIYTLAPQTLPSPRLSETSSNSSQEPSSSSDSTISSNTRLTQKVTPPVQINTRNQSLANKPTSSSQVKPLATNLIKVSYSDSDTTRVYDFGTSPIIKNYFPKKEKELASRRKAGTSGRKVANRITK